MERSPEGEEDATVCPESMEWMWAMDQGGWVVEWGGVRFGKARPEVPGVE